MKKIHLLRNKILAVFLSGILSFSVFVPTINVYANDISINSTVETTFPTPKESDYNSIYGERSAVTKIVKSAIKFIIKNKKASAEVIERVAGKTVAKNFLKYFDDITDAINPLLKWSDIPAQAVYDAVLSGLLNANVSRPVATNIALAIKEGLSWFI